MISINNLSYKYPTVAGSVLRNINLSIKTGDFVLIEGKSGSGKSTLLYCLNGLIPHLLGGSLGGAVSINGRDPKDLSVSALSKVVGTVFQNPENQLFMPTVKEDIAFGCRNAGYSEEEIGRRTDRALEAFGLAVLKDKSIEELSAGQKQKVAIAGIYAAGPDILLFDEPTANLDNSGKKDFVEILKMLKSDGKTVIIAEHDFEDILELCDKKYNLEDGELSEVIEHRIDADDVACNSQSIISREAAISMVGASFSYDNKTDVISDVTMKIAKGDSVAIVGDNGCGKTTLFKIMMGVIKPGQGTVNVLGLPKPSLDDIVGKAGLLFQNPDEQLFTETVEDEIMFGPRYMNVSFDIDSELKYFGLEQYRAMHPHSLSKGERQRVAFISALASRPEIILLDEPTTGLDYDNWTRLMNAAESFRKKGTTVIFSTHNSRVVRRYARRVITLDKGRIISDEVSK